MRDANSLLPLVHKFFEHDSSSMTSQPAAQSLENMTEEAWKEIAKANGLPTETRE